MRPRRKCRKQFSASFKEPIIYENRYAPAGRRLVDVAGELLRRTMSQRASGLGKVAYQNEIVCFRVTRAPHKSEGERESFYLRH